ncbi:MAG: hypothetical protein K5686_03980 [Lachnospiraceae bacterium]|nr:hypothetical protein [Lachnospiraceae bacterium]
MSGAGSEGGLGARRPLSREQIARRTVSREEVARWTSEFNQNDIKRLQYWESKETVDISEPGDQHLIFAGKWDMFMAKVWTIIDPKIPHKAYILRPEKNIKYELHEKDGILQRFQFRDEVRIYNDKGLTAVIEGREMTIFQKGDDVIIKMEDTASRPIRA